MARTVPRNITRKGEHLSRCDVCSCPYLRSSLRRGRDGLLRCPQDQPGRDEVTLAELTANRAAMLAAKSGMGLPADGAAPDTDSDGNNASASSYTGPTRRFTAEDIYASGVPTYLNPGTRVNLPGF